MPHQSIYLRTACFLLLMEALALVIPSSNAFDRERPVQESHSPNTSGSLSHLLRYISSGWDFLTRSMSSCKALEDVKTGGKPILYLPAGQIGRAHV